MLLKLNTIFLFSILEQQTPSLLQDLKDIFVGQGGDVAEVGLAACDLSQDAAHDFTGTSFRQVRGFLKCLNSISCNNNQTITHTEPSLNERFDLGNVTGWMSFQVLSNSA